MKAATLHDPATATAAPAAGKPGERLRHMLGLDVDLNGCVMSVQTGNGANKVDQIWIRGLLLKWVQDRGAEIVFADSASAVATINAFPRTVWAVLRMPADNAITVAPDTRRQSAD